MSHADYCVRFWNRLSVGTNRSHFSTTLRTQCVSCMLISAPNASQSLRSYAYTNTGFKSGLQLAEHFNRFRLVCKCASTNERHSATTAELLSNVLCADAAMSFCESVDVMRSGYEIQTMM